MRGSADTKGAEKLVSFIACTVMYPNDSVWNTAAQNTRHVYRYFPLDNRLNFVYIKWFEAPVRSFLVIHENDFGAFVLFDIDDHAVDKIA